MTAQTQAATIPASRMTMILLRHSSALDSHARPRKTFRFRHGSSITVLLLSAELTGETPTTARLLRTATAHIGSTEIRSGLRLYTPTPSFQALTDFLRSDSQPELLPQLQSFMRGWQTIPVMMLRSRTRMLLRTGWITLLQRSGHSRSQRTELL